MQQSVPRPSFDMERTTDKLSAREKLDLVQRVVSSPPFSRAPALRAFLLYIAQNAIANRDERIKEQSIGAEVLGRRPDYDPADDNIVRVRAHELRQKLEKYFANDGVHEPFIITIPKGTYKPEFLHRVVEEQPKPLEIPKLLDNVVPVATVFRASRRHWLALSVSANLILLALLLVFLFLKQGSRGIDPPPSPALRDFWGQIFQGQGELKVIPADSGFALWQDLSGHTVNLGDYLSRRYLSLAGEQFREVATRRLTSPADVVVSTRLALMAQAFGGRYNLQYARDVDARSIRNTNVAIIGSHRSNPWLEVFEPELNFVLERDPVSGAPSFRNRAPQAGEVERYSIPTTLDVQGAEEQEFESYGLIALRRSCNAPHFAVLVEGLNMQATEAAGEIVTDAQALNSLLKDIHHQSGTNVASFEALIRLKSLPGGYADPRVIAYRKSSPESCKN